MSSSTIERLRVKKNEFDLTMHNLNSMHDQQFLLTMKKHPYAQSLRDTVVNVSVREDNINAYERTGLSNVTHKELHILIKSNDHQRILEYLHSLDDMSLVEACKHPIIADIVQSSVSLSSRYELIRDLPQRDPEQYVSRFKPIPFKPHAY